MSFVPERQRRLIIEILQKKISKDDFYRQYPVKADEAGRLSVDMLRTAIERRDADGVEYGLYLMGLFGPSPEHLDLLLDLVIAGWHMSHEMAVDYLSYFDAPVSAQPFYRVALSQHPYRDYDDADSLGVKAIWALGRLQTEEAVGYLGELATCGRPILEQNARQQLARIVSRSESESLREAAQRRLETLAKREK